MSIPFLHVFFLILLKKANSFTFKRCEFSDYNCTDEFNQSYFSLDVIKNFGANNNGESYISINLINNNESVNLDDFYSDDIFYIFIIKDISSSEVIIQTSITDESKSNLNSRIIAEGVNITFENINPAQGDSVYLKCNEIVCSTLSLKGTSKSLYLYSSNINVRKFNVSNIYVSSFLSTFYIYESDNDQLNIFYTSKVTCIIDIHDDEEYCYEIGSPYFYIPENVTIEYGKMRISYEFPSNKKVILSSDTNRLNVINYIVNGTIIKAENDLIENDLLTPYFNYQSWQKTVSQNYPIIEGNWPIVTKSEIAGYFLENGSYVSSYHKRFRIDGPFVFKAKNFPANDFSRTTLYLAERSSSFYIMDNYVQFVDNLTIENEGEASLSFEGTTAQFDDYYYLFANSPNLTIFANAMNELNLIGNARVVYKRILNSFQRFKSVVNFQEGGVISVPYSVDYESLSKSFGKLYEEYLTDNKLTEPESDKVSEWSNFYIKFALSKIGDIADILNDLENKIVPLTIVPVEEEEEDNDDDAVSILSIARNDFPITALYKNGLNKTSNVICAKSGSIGNLTSWNTRVGMNILRGIFGDPDDEEIVEIFDRFVPSFSNTYITSEFEETEDGRCIGFRPTSIPGSSFEFIFYTSNETYIQILEKIELVVTLTESDLDASSKIKSNITKNFIVVVLDDLPEGKAINLGGIRGDSNVFLLGFKSASISDVYQMFDDLDALNWTELGSDEYELQENRIYQNFFSKISKYQVKTSVTFSSIQSFIVANVDYFGTHINCQNFYAASSSFSNLEQLKNDFNAVTTLTESVTYKKMADLEFNDLVIFPLSFDPLNLLVVDQINFTQNYWHLRLDGILKDDTFKIKEKVNYSIDASKIKGKMIVYSYTSNITFNIPESTVEDGLEVKAISVNSHFTTNLRIKEIPGMITLENNENTKRVKSFIKRIKSFLNEPKAALLSDDESDEVESITFTGNWSKVERVVGSFEINTGSEKAVVNDVPIVALQSLDVRSEKDIEVSGEGKTDELRSVKFVNPQIISQRKVMNYTNLNVSFTNLTFTGSNPSLLVSSKGDTKTVITDDVKVSTGTAAKINNQELVVEKSFEFGPESSLIASNVITNNPDLILNYRLASIPLVPDFLTGDNKPKSLTLNYIGESDNIDHITDYSQFVGMSRDLLNFKDQSECDGFKEKVKLSSDFYSEFEGDDRVVDVACNNDGSLFFNVTSLPTGAIKIPSEYSVVEKSSKKKFPIGAIIGIVVGAVVLIAIISILIWYFAFHKKKLNLSKELSDREEDSVGL